MKRTKSLERYFYALNYEARIKSKLTKKQFAVYTYLLSISKWDAQTSEYHYYVYWNSFQVKDAIERIKISKATWYSAIEKLKKTELIKISDEYKAYIILFPKEYAPLNIKLISFLLDFSAVINNSGNLTGVYATLYKYWKNCQDNDVSCCVTLTSLNNLFESSRELENIKYYQLLLALFKSTGLMYIKEHQKKYCGKKYIEYEIEYVNMQLPEIYLNDYYGPDNVKDIVEALQNSIVDMEKD